MEATSHTVAPAAHIDIYVYILWAAVSLVRELAVPL